RQECVQQVFSWCANSSRCYSPSLCFLLIPHPPTSPLFPYTTLFRSLRAVLHAHQLEVVDHHQSQITALLLQAPELGAQVEGAEGDRKSTRLNSSHVKISYAVFCLKKKKN